MTEGLPQQLSIAEALTLVALNDETGFPKGGYTRLDDGLAGALLCELALAGRIAADPSADAGVLDRDVTLRPGHTPKHRKLPLVVRDETQIGDELCDGVLAILVAAEQPKRPFRWMHKFKKLRPYRSTIESLLLKGIVKEEKKRVALVFKQRRALPIDPSAEQQLKLELNEAMTSAELTLDTPLMAVAALAWATGFDREVYPRDRLAAIHKRIGNAVSDSQAPGEGIAATVAVIADDARQMIASDETTVTSPTG